METSRRCRHDFHHLSPWSQPPARRTSGLAYEARHHLESGRARSAPDRAAGEPSFDRRSAQSPRPAARASGIHGGVLGSGHRIPSARRPRRLTEDRILIRYWLLGRCANIGPALSHLPQPVRTIGMWWTCPTVPLTVTTARSTPFFSLG